MGVSVVADGVVIISLVERPGAFHGITRRTKSLATGRMTVFESTHWLPMSALGQADIVECLRVVRFSPQGRTLSGRDQPIADIVSFIRLSLVNPGKHCSLVE